MGETRSAHERAEVLALLDFDLQAVKLAALQANRQIPLRYTDAAGNPTMAYPENPNGSIDSIHVVLDGDTFLCPDARDVPASCS